MTDLGADDSVKGGAGVCIPTPGVPMKERICPPMSEWKFLCMPSAGPIARCVPKLKTCARASPPNNQSNLHAGSLIYSSFVALTPTTLPHLSHTHSIATPKFYGKDEKVPFGIAMIMGLQHMYLEMRPLENP